MYAPGANSLVAQSVKKKKNCLPAVQETRVREDPLEKEVATYSSSFAWKTPWTEEPGGLQSMGSQESDTTQQQDHHQHSVIAAESPDGVYISGQQVDKLSPINYVVSHREVRSTENSLELGRWVEGMGKGSVIFMECSGRFDELSVFNYGPERDEETNLS